MNAKTTTTSLPEISSWNEKIFTFGIDHGAIESNTLDAQIDQTLAGFGEPMNPVDPCGQFTCSGYWPLQ